MNKNFNDLASFEHRKEAAVFFSYFIKSENDMI